MRWFAKKQHHRVMCSLVGVTALLTSPSIGGLIHYYPFTSDAADVVGVANGTLMNGASVSGGTLFLDGVDDFVQLSQVIVPGSGSYSVAMLARQTAPQNTYIELISQQSSGGPSFYIGHDPSGIIRVSDSWLNTGVPFPSDGLFHHFAVIVDAGVGESRLYVDGVLQATLGFSIATTPGANTRFGRQFGFVEEFFGGDLDEIRIYDHALTAVEVAQLQTTKYVDDDNCPGPGVGSVGNPFCSIQDAIDASVNGDTVEVATGTYVEAIDFGGKAITVRSTTPTDPVVVAATIIDGSGSLHVVQCVNGEGADSVLNGFVITGGRANGLGFPNDSGAGMSNSGTSPTVLNCTFIGNIADSLGGGMLNSGGAPTITDCTFSGNRANFGGGMNNSSSSGSISGCTFVGNLAIDQGGGMSVSAGLPSIDDCIFIANATVTGGGGLANTGGTFIELSGNAFCSNTPDQRTGNWTDNGGNTFLDTCPPISACPADLNGDSNVTVLDLLAMLASWGACP